MFIYLFLFILIIIFCFKYDYQSHNNTNKHNSFYLLCIILSLVAGLRYHIGSDTANYMEDFEEIPTINDFLNAIELEDLSQSLWYLFNSICKSIIDDFILIQLIHSFIVNILIGRFIYKTCKKPFIALLAYLCCCWWNFNFEIMRESLCISIYLNLIYEYIQKNNIYKFLLYSSPLFLIHHFAFIPIILTFLLHFVKYKHILYFGLPVTIIVYFLSSEASLTGYLALFSGTLGEGDVMIRAMNYIQSSQYGFITSNIIGIAFILLTKVLYSFVVSLDKGINPMIAKLLLLCGLVYILQLKIMIFVRFVNYWQIILFVYAINYFLSNKKNIIYSYMIVVFVYNVYLGINSFLTPLDIDKSKYDSRYIPYSSYFDKTINPVRESLFY